MKAWFAGILVASACAIGLAISPAAARTLPVGTCTGSAPNFPTIQAAVNASFAGDIIEVCPGSYPEQVTITHSLKLTNVATMAQPSIVAPPGGVVQNASSLGSSFPTAAQILVSPTGHAVVNISNIIVDGSNNGITAGCGLDLVGIYYQNAGGTISNTIVQNQILQNPALLGCQDGQGILVENKATPGPGKVVIYSNSVSNFQKNGITFHLASAYGNISKNMVTGIGPTSAIAQNGIEIAYGATANITQNNVQNLIYTPATYGSAGILLYSVPASTVAHLPKIQNNAITSAQYGIVLDGVPGLSGTLTDMLQIGSNTIANSAFAGVGLYSDSSLGLSNDYVYVKGNTITNASPYDGIDACSNNNFISKNTIANAAQSGIHLDATCIQPDSTASGVGNLVSANHVTVACVGVLSGPAQGTNVIPNNNVYLDVSNRIVYGADSYSCGPAVTGATAMLLSAATAPTLPPPSPARH